MQEINYKVKEVYNEENILFHEQEINDYIYLNFKLFVESGEFACQKIKQENNSFESLNFFYENFLFKFEINNNQEF